MGFFEDYKISVDTEVMASTKYREMALQLNIPKNLEDIVVYNKKTKKISIQRNGREITYLDRNYNIIDDYEHYTIGRYYKRMCKLCEVEYEKEKTVCE